MIYLQGMGTKNFKEIDETEVRLFYIDLNI